MLVFFPDCLGMFLQTKRGQYQVSRPLCLAPQPAALVVPQKSNPSRPCSLTRPRCGR